MIGGIDVEISTEFPNEVAEQIHRVVRLDWPDCIAEDVETGDRIETFQLEFSQPTREVFLYRDEASKQLWDKEGVTESNANTMIHVVPHDAGVTVVVDDASEVTIQRIIGSVREFASDLRLQRTELVR